MSKSKPIKLTQEQMELASRLTPLQRKFVINLVSSNMSQREAYYAAGGATKTPEAADANASRMLSLDKVKEFYDSLMNSMAQDAIMTKQEALGILTRSARVTIKDICDFTLQQVGEDEDGNQIMQTVWVMKHSDEIDPHVLEAIKSVTFTKTGPKIEMYDRNGSIKILSDLQGWNAPKKTELTGKDGAAINMNVDVSAPEVAAALNDLMSKL